MSPESDVGARLNTYIINDRKYKIAAITVTTRRFGPSGSSKKANITLEHTIAVMPEMSREVHFDLKYIGVQYN